MKWTYLDLAGEVAGEDAELERDGAAAIGEEHGVRSILGEFSFSA